MSPIERELKFPVSELDTVRRRLGELGAEKLHDAGMEDNLLFDRGDELRDASCLLRLRSDRAGGRLTFKGPPRFDGATKLREEREVEVGDLGEMQAILERLGFSIHRRYQKVREEWCLDGAVVALDHTPIGEFVEIEGDAAEGAARRCGLDPEGAEPRNYLQLYEDYQHHHPEAPPDMVFTVAESAT